MRLYIFDVETLFVCFFHSLEVAERAGSRSAVWKVSCEVRIVGLTVSVLGGLEVMCERHALSAVRMRETDRQLCKGVVGSGEYGVL